MPYKQLSILTAESFSETIIRKMEKFILNEFNFDILWIFDYIFKYKYKEEEWALITCMLTFDNQKSIENILSQPKDIIMEKIMECKSMKHLRDKCFEIIKSI